MKLNFFQNAANKAATSEKPVFDLGRAKFRLEGLSHYASVSALLLNAALRLFCSTPKKLDNRKEENAVKIAFLIFTASTVVLGAYTTTVFSLLSLYSKTFLGMGMDDEYTTFIESTSEIRKSAFLSFVGTIFSFNFSFVLSLYLTYEGQVRVWITTITALAIAIGAQNWILLMHYGAKMLEYA